MFNKIILVGNLTRDIELKYTNGGTALAKTAVATTRKFTTNGERKEEVCFVDITFFGRSAEIANQYLRKGSKCLVEGRLMFEQWTDQQGQKRSKHSVTVESMQMLDTKAESQQRENHSYDSTSEGGVQSQHPADGGAIPPDYGQAQQPPSQTDNNGAYVPEGADVANQRYQDSLPENQPKGNP
jgi:single-strand DNA-binding protein